MSLSVPGFVLPQAEKEAKKADEMRRIKQSHHSTGKRMLREEADGRKRKSSAKKTGRAGERTRGAAVSHP